MAVSSGDGDNVSSNEMEDVLFRRSAECDAPVFGVPPDELIRQLREESAGSMVPQRIELGSERLPTSGADKVVARRRCEPHWQGHDSGVGGR